MTSARIPRGVMARDPRGLIYPLLLLALLQIVKASNEPWLKSEKHAELGTEVLLPCVLKSPQCEGLHSIKWYRGATRIFIFSEDDGITRGNNDIAVRFDIEYATNATKAFLKIPDVKLEDEGLYKCEATYLAVNRECNNVQHIILNVTVQPAFVRVIDESTKNTLSTGATLGPINEGTAISLYCESGEGKPVPTVEWFKGDQLLDASSTSTPAENGIGTGSSVLQMQITRAELGAIFTCRVNSIALAEPLTVDVKLDVHVRPLKMDLNGLIGHAVQGTKILLQCTVKAARPAANVTWQNGTDYLEAGNERFEMFETKVQENEDGTSETKSHLAFTASEYDNGRTFKCYAENSVTRSEDLKPMQASTTIEVLYPPIVSMKPNNITVNETENVLIFCDYEANPASLVKVTWLRDDEELLLTDEHYEGGSTEQTALTVKNATPGDMGSYKCVLENNVGPSVSEDSVEVSVLFKPVVEVIMDPETPLNEADRLNVSLTCEVVSGNPASLSAVRWYLDGDLLKELPDCSRNATTGSTTTEESLTFCDIDPSKLLLEAVGRSFHGNYSCEGRNDAGWGPLSASAPVIVYYKPGPASISYEPKQVIKKRPVSITCSVQDPGRPKVVGFKWFRGLHRLPDENEATLAIESVNLETEANFTCLAYNEAGDGDPATTFIDVSAPPGFIKKLKPYHGYVYNSPNVSIMCWVECAPICNISWLKDGIPMDFSKTSRYYLSNVHHPPDSPTNDFESIQSTLVWNLTAWPSGQLDRVEDNVMFTCESSSNGIGPGVKSSTHFHVEFPPENITISRKMINVTVDTVPETVSCNAKAHPEPTFRWFREGSADTIVDGRILDLKMPVPRRSNGTYYCEASNRHGTRNISMVINVQFKPECHVEKERIDGEDYVVCSAIANPKETDYVWTLKSDNDTLDQPSEKRYGKSYMRLDGSVTNFRTYVCIANNTIGQSNTCERDVPGNTPWYHQLEGNLLLIVIVAAVVLILVIIIICVVIFIVCRRKRSQMKYSNRVVELEEREHPDGGPPSPAVSSHSTDPPVQPTPAPRWPLKPGVLVHINRSHSLRSGLSSRTNESLVSRNRESTARQAKVVRAQSKETTLASHRALGVAAFHEDGMLARANKIKAMFGVQLKEQATLPGISREKTAVTYKRITPRDVQESSSGELGQVLHSRKRKKPGADPNQAANNNHVNSVSEGLPDSGAKTFYENLPFHGIQAPPNKSVSPVLARASALHGSDGVDGGRQTATPGSVAVGGSQCDASSGYESTRSHLGPHYARGEMPRGNSPVPRYNSLKPRRRKHRRSQFYSLRLCPRHHPRDPEGDARHCHRKYELYAIPICKGCTHLGGGSTSTLATLVGAETPEKSAENSSNDLLGTDTGATEGRDDLGGTDLADDLIESLKSLATNDGGDKAGMAIEGQEVPPIPAPRRSRPTDPSKHTYQNVPSPVFPQHADPITDQQTDSLYNYKEHYQQQQQPPHAQQQQQQAQHRQEMQQYSYPLASNSSSRLTLPLTRSLYHSSIVSPLQTSYAHTNNRPSSLPRQEQQVSAMHEDQEYQEQPPPSYSSQETTRQQQQSTAGRRHSSSSSSSNRRNERNRKYRKHERPERKQKQRRNEGRRGSGVHEPAYGPSPSCETSFQQQELGIPETYKSAYPHYYEDAIAHGPAEYLRTQRPAAHMWDRAIDRQDDDPVEPKPRGKQRRPQQPINDARSPSAPTIMHFRDVGQEIDV